MAQLVKLVVQPTMRETQVQSVGWEDSPGERKDYQLQYSGLENSMACIVRGVAKSRTRLSSIHLYFSAVRSLLLLGPIIIIIIFFLVVCFFLHNI